MKDLSIFFFFNSSSFLTVCHIKPFLFIYLLMMSPIEWICGDPGLFEHATSLMVLMILYAKELLDV